ncbi:uncharacterized protein LOC131007200 [Salvia miltiorrhiza]|uniref:uncharacterized protein LOC131007200 n=1 Tax=Salvia miltiorrhiza TaxID=226208 RepID=UPI0025AD230D|nr:uncharacterized protein LOC131007200 [Salvia miltiorrhiza]
MAPPRPMPWSRSHANGVDRRRLISSHSFDSSAEQPLAEDWYRRASSLSVGQQPQRRLPPLYPPPFTVNGQRPPRRNYHWLMLSILRPDHRTWHSRQWLPRRSRKIAIAADAQLLQSPTLSDPTMAPGTAANGCPAVGEKSPSPPMPNFSDRPPLALSHSVVGLKIAITADAQLLRSPPIFTLEWRREEETLRLHRQLLSPLEIVK